jgi:hypothetical protein
MSFIAQLAKLRIVVRESRADENVARADDRINDGSSGIRLTSKRLSTDAPQRSVTLRLRGERVRNCSQYRR